MAKGKKPKGSGQKLQKEISPSEESQEENIETQNGFLLIADIADFENDIIAVQLDEEMKNALRCEIGTDLFIDKPWKTIPKSVLCEQASKKAFQPYEKVIEDYPFSEILVGYEPFGYGKADEYLVCITERGRNRVLEQLKLLRESYIQSAEKANSLKPRPWESLGSEKEIGIDKDVYNRPLISFEWIGNIISRTRKKPKFEPTFAHKAKYGYNCVKDTRHTYDLVEKLTSDVSCQAGPTISTVESQTVTEIPIHASTQYKPEEEIPVNRGISSKAEGSALEKHVKLYADRIIKAIEYNQEYDLYKDDYKDLALAGKEFDLSPNHIYKHYLTFNDILQIEGKVITDTAWHPNLTGVVAASYGVDVPSKIEHLDSNSDDTEYEPEDTDPEPEEEPEVEPHDQKLRKAWLDGARQYEKNVTQVNMDHWHRAMRTLNVIENAKLLRNYQIELAIKEEETVEEEDTESENAFEYVMFEDLASRLLKKKMAVAKKKLKKKLKHVRKKLRARRKKKALERASKEVEDLSGEMPPEGTEEIIPKILPETSEKILEKLSPKISKEKNKKKKKKHRKKKKSDGKNKKSHKKHHRRKCKKKKAMKKSQKKSQKSKNAASKKERIPRWAKMFVNNPASSYGNEFGRNKQNVFSVNLDFVPKFEYFETRNLLKHFQFERVWGRSPSWFMGDHMRSVAAMLHRKYNAQAVKAVGDVPLGPIMEQPHKQMEGKFGFPSQPVTEIANKAKIEYFEKVLKEPTTSKRVPPLKGRLQKIFPKKKKTGLRDTLKSNDYVIITDNEEELNEEVLCADNDLHPVLIWSFQNDLSPLLRLDSPYEIRTISFCPHDGNLVVGGTVTGRLVLWDITGKLDLRSTHRKRDRQKREANKIIEKLMKWRKDVRFSRRVSHTALSSINDSHRTKVVHLQWLHPCLEISVGGQFAPLTENAPLTLQLVTASEDGNICFWDLRATPVTDSTKKPIGVKLQRKHSSLCTPVSAYKQFDQKWSPIYTVKCYNENKLPILISCICFEPKPFKFKRVKPPKGPQKMEDIIEYAFVPQPVTPMQKNAFVGTMEGVVGYISWHGQQDLKNAANSDYAEVNMFKPFHDGPINSLDRHPYFPHICLSTGGHVFAIWHTDYLSSPIKWQRYYGVQVTAGSWSPLRPSLFRIARSDGTVEVWDLMLQSHAPKIKIPASGRVITATTSPLLPLPKGLLGIADNNASLRFYYIPWMYQLWTMSELNKLEQFINTEPLRKQNMHEWIIQWNKTHIKSGRALGLKKLTPRTETAVEEEIPEKATQLERYRDEVYKWYLRRRGKQSLWLDESWQKWYEKEEAHMIQTILTNKGWNKKKMDKTMKPLLKLEALKLERQIKVDDLLSQADEIFQAAIATIFPEGNAERKASLVSVRIGSVPMEDVDDAFKEIDLLFGEYYKEIENEHEEIVNGLKWAKNVPPDFILNKYNGVREIFNDRRRWRDPKLRWIRMKIKKAIEDSGFIYSAWESHKDKYLCLRKIKRRMHNITYLRKLYGDNYDPYWDKETVTDDIPLECKESKEKREKQQNELEECLELLAEGKLAAAQKYLTIQKIRKREEGLDEMMEPIELESSEVTYEEFSDEEEKQKEITSIESPSSKIQIESSRPTIDESEEDLQEGSISSIDKPMDTVPKRSVSFLEFDQNLDFESSEDELDLDTQSLTLKAEMKTQSTSTSEEEEFYEGEPPVRYIPPPRLMPSDFSLEDEEPDEPEYSEEEGEGEEEEGDEEEDKGKVEGQLKEGFGISSPTAKHLKHTSDEDDEFNEID